MSWKKNVFSCLLWAVYLLMLATAMIFTGRMICGILGLAEYLKIVIPAVYLLFTGIIVFGLHRLTVGLKVDPQSVGKTIVWIERVLVLVLFGAGIFLRVLEMQPELYVRAAGSDYLKLAYVSVDGQEVPRFSHGAVYLYIWVLRLCFMLLGNKASLAVLLQTVLQMFSVLLLRPAIRKMAGRIPALMMVSFFMLSPYMVEKSLEISPQMLYLLLFSVALLLISQGVQYVFGWSFWLAAGFMVAALSYLDVAGIILLPLMIGVIVMRRQSANRKIAGGFLGGLIGFLSGVAGCVFVDMMGSGKPVSQVIRAWWELYQWGDLQLPVRVTGFDTVWTITLIVCLMTWGIFSFWCSRGVERFTVWILCLFITVFMQIMGMFTEEMGGLGYIFFLSTVLAGLGIRESIAVCLEERSGEDGTVKNTVETVEVQMRENQPSAESGGKSQNGRNQSQDNSADDILRDPEERKQIIEEENKAVDGKDKAENPNSAVDGKDKAENPNSVVDGKDKAESPNNTVDGKDKAENQNNTIEKAATAEQKPKIEFLENPLPLPKKHEKRTMDYQLKSVKDDDGYDIDVAEDDDFDH